MEVLTIVISDDIGNINLEVGGFRPHTTMQGAGFCIPRGAKMRHCSATVYLSAVVVVVWGVWKAAMTTKSVRFHWSRMEIWGFSKHDSEQPVKEAAFW